MDRTGTLCCAPQSVSEWQLNCTAGDRLSFTGWLTFVSFNSSVYRCINKNRISLLILTEQFIYVNSKRSKCFEIANVTCHRDASKLLLEKQLVVQYGSYQN